MTDSFSPFFNIDPEENLISEITSCNYITVDYWQEILNEPKFFTMINYNIRSFNLNINSFLSIFENGNLPQILVFSETWFTEDSSIDLQNFSSFHTYRCDRRSGGVSLFVNSNFISYKIPALCVSNDVIEICTVCVNFNNKFQYILAIYRPHGGTIPDFTTALLDILESGLISGKPCYVVGDLNINLLSNSCEVETFKNAMHSYSFISVITRPTRFQENNVPSLLDHIWRNRYSFCTCGIVLYDLTDHYPTFMRIPLISQQSESTLIEFRPFNDNQKHIFFNSLTNYDWEALRSNDVNIYMENFINSLNSIFDRSFPFKRKYVSNRHLNNVWMTSELRKLVKFKSQYFHLHRIGIVSTAENRMFSNRVKCLIKQSKENYFRKILNLNRNNMQKTWKTLNYLIKGNLDKNHIKHLIVNDIDLFEADEIAIVMNNYFSSIPNDLNSNLPNSNIDPLSYLNVNVHRSLFLNPITAIECIEIISSLKNSNQGAKMIPVSLIKQFSSVLAPVISDIFNNCFIGGKFPSILKSAIITPILKKGDPRNCENYRPISILPFFSKVLERCIYTRLYKFIHDNSSITSCQFGFLKGLSTEKAIIYLTEFLYDTLDAKEIALTVFVDFTKAFDMVNHEILLAKLYRYGIRGVALDLFKSYLSDRTQAVRIKNAISPPKLVNIGVPQGSILGPILFILYINDLPNFSNQSFTSLYADDTTLTFRNDNLIQLLECCNTELVKFHKWTLANRLIMNASKTQYMVFTNRNVDLNSVSILVNNVPLERVDCFKYLGLVIDEKLSYKLHCQYISGKISRSLGVFYRIRNNLDLQCLKMLYYSLIHPYLFYCNLVWGNARFTHINPVFVLQKRSMRIIFYTSFRSPSNPLFNSANILKIHDVYKLALGCYIYENSGSEVFVRDHSYETRFSSHLLPSFRRLYVSQQSVYYLGPVLWNSLPDMIKNSSNLLLFKTRLKKYLLGLYGV